MNIKNITIVCLLCLTVLAISCGSKKEEKAIGQELSFEQSFLNKVASKDIVTIVSIADKEDLTIPLVSFSDDGSVMTLEDAEVVFLSADSENRATYSSAIGTAIVVLDDNTPVSILLDDGTDMLGDLAGGLNQTHGDSISVLFAIQ